jgi:hypothetical protein
MGEILLYNMVLVYSNLNAICRTDCGICQVKACSRPLDRKGSSRLELDL